MLYFRHVPYLHPHLSIKALKRKDVQRISTYLRTGREPRDHSSTTSFYR